MKPHLSGSKNGRAKLTLKDVEEIREKWRLFGGRKDTEMGAGNHHVTSIFKLALEYGVACSTMGSIITGKSWRLNGKISASTTDRKENSSLEMSLVRRKV